MKIPAADTEGPLRFSWSLDSVSGDCAGFGLSFPGDPGDGKLWDGSYGDEIDYSFPCKQDGP